ncbi:dNTP triphosphohydrolase [Thiotrichales bacterium 19S9-12]|nr:dNTP triphosphohydrolase [Thiotrichales bacterium 19S9-11]MCF6811857.1 dNTP triphosphohydrolase [Thiotrichales bacterium 19S9-12]
MSFYQSKDFFRPFSEDEYDKPSFTPFRRDYARVVHCAAFRRLQGKTQIFPGLESDFFRNRLTHSLEVAQVAKAITARLNETYQVNIDYDLVETAALCHDIGHPPFGHNGERALHEKMREYGGFEGNAQTLRVLTRVEKKILDGEVPIFDGEDKRYGLNLTYRTLASVLKYDSSIPPYVSQMGIEPPKGYYTSELALVNSIKSHVLSGYNIDADQVEFKTIECQIMDLADDIAYSTYDLEDALKGGFLSPVSMIGSDQKLLERVQKAVLVENDLKLSPDEIREVVKGIFSSVFSVNEGLESFYQKAKLLAQSGYLRTKLTSELVFFCLNGIEFELNQNCPALSKVSLSREVKVQVEVLKQFIFQSVIKATKLNIVRYRGGDIVSTLFDLLSTTQRELSFLPEDVGEVYYAYEPSEKAKRKRIICDFIAGMTDRYAIELYGRFKSDKPQTIFKPL